MLPGFGRARITRKDRKPPLFGWVRKKESNCARAVSDLPEGSDTDGLRHFLFESQLDLIDADHKTRVLLKHLDPCSRIHAESEQAFRRISGDGHHLRLYAQLEVSKRDDLSVAGLHGAASAEKARRVEEPVSDSPDDERISHNESYHGERVSDALLFHHYQEVGYAWNE